MDVARAVGVLIVPVFFIYGAVLHVESRREMFRVRDQLGLMVAPEFLVLIVFLAIFALLKITVAVGLGFLMWGRV